MKTDVPFADLRELLYERRIAIGADTVPAFHIKFGGIGLLDRVIAADVDIEPGPFILAEEVLYEKVFAAHGMRYRKAFHFEFFHNLTQQEMQTGISERINNLIAKRHEDGFFSRLKGSVHEKR
jgi:hypothetical protein